MAGRPSRAITLAIVKVLPEPVTPSSVWNASPSSMPSTSCSIAVGWSPAGRYGWNSWNGELSNETNSPRAAGAGGVAAASMISDIGLP